jgi:hypothetical protein
LKVVDARALSGDTLSMARAITALPFTDYQDSSRFQNSFTCTSNVSSCVPGPHRSYTA